MIDGVVRRVSSPVLVGRDGEFGQLRAVLERAASGQPAIVVVAGEAGVGKTRLLAELTRQATGAGVVALVLTYRSDELHRPPAAAVSGGA